MPSLYVLVQLILLIKITEKRVQDGHLKHGYRITKREAQNMKISDKSLSSPGDRF